jgi:hypothetical protein
MRDIDIVICICSIIHSPHHHGSVSLVELSIIIFDVSRTHTIGHIFGTIPLDKWRARRKDLFSHNTQHS